MQSIVKALKKHCKSMEKHNTNKQWKAKKTQVLAFVMNLLPNPENPRKAKFARSLITNRIETKQPQAKTPPKPGIASTLIKNRFCCRRATKHIQYSGCPEPTFRPNVSVHDAATRKVMSISEKH